MKLLEKWTHEIARWAFVTTNIFNDYTWIHAKVAPLFDAQYSRLSVRNDILLLFWGLVPPKYVTGSDEYVNLVSLMLNRQIFNVLPSRRCSPKSNPGIFLKWNMALIPTKWFMAFIPFFFYFIISATGPTKGMYTTRHYKRYGRTGYAFLDLFIPIQRVSSNCPSSVRTRLGSKRALARYPISHKDDVSLDLLV